MLQPQKASRPRVMRSLSYFLAQAGPKTLPPHWLFRWMRIGIGHELTLRVPRPCCRCLPSIRTGHADVVPATSGSGDGEADVPAPCVLPAVPVGKELSLTGSYSWLVDGKLRTRATRCAAARVVELVRNPGQSSQSRRQLDGRAADGSGHRIPGAQQPGRKSRTCRPLLRSGFATVRP